MNTAAVSWISGSSSVAPGAKRIRNTSEFFRKLSLKALKNWHQNSGAKRRVGMRIMDIGQALWTLRVPAELGLRRNAHSGGRRTRSATAPGSPSAPAQQRAPGRTTHHNL